jgi:hypothetical protein
MRNHDGGNGYEQVSVARRDCASSVVSVLGMLSTERQRDLDASENDLKQIPMIQTTGAT